MKLSNHMLAMFSIHIHGLLRHDHLTLLYLYLVEWKLILLCSFPIPLLKSTASTTASSTEHHLRCLLLGCDLRVRRHGITRNTERFLLLAYTGQSAGNTVSTS